MFAEIILAKPTSTTDKIYHYKMPEELANKINVGSQVFIPFGNSTRVGYVIGLIEKSNITSIKPILNVVSKIPVFTKDGLKLAKWISEYYKCFFITALRCLLPPSIKRKESNKQTTRTRKHIKIKKNPDKLNTTYTATSIQLTNDQEKAIQEITPHLNSTEGKIFLLHGISGSGKTEVYFKIIEEAYKKGLGSILLVPEIGLSEQLVKSFEQRFNNLFTSIHSGLTDKERSCRWQDILDGKYKIVLGTRMAIFAPVKNLKVLILDEEQETTYKQEQNPKYNAKTIAAYLSKNRGMITIYGSATPSIETFYRTQTNQIKLLKLNERINKSLAPIEIVDMKSEKNKTLSSRLQQEIKETLSRNEKILLFVNRRGFFTYQICKQCGHTIQCPNCSSFLTYHYKENKLICKYCNLTTNINIICPNCKSSQLLFLGIGTQKIEEQVAALFPKAIIIRIDKDAITKKDSYKKALSAFSQGHANVLIGTQMITKGLDVELVTLVGIISADSMLSLPDFRATEYAFDQIMQIAGRSGRHTLPGKVIIQTYNPNHYAIKAAASYDYESFYDEEIKNRDLLFYPPFSKLISLTIQGNEEKTTLETAEKLKFSLINQAKAFKDKIEIMGPVQALVFKMRGHFRWQILIKGQNIEQIQTISEKSISQIIPPNNVKININIDP